MRARLAALLSVSGAVSEARVPACPARSVRMANFSYTAPGAASKVHLIVCEDLSSANGSITFVLSGANQQQQQPWPLVLHKSVSPIEPHGNSSDYYLNYSKTAVLSAPSDVLGNQLLGIHGHPPRISEPSLAEVMSAVPPTRAFGNSFDPKDTVRVWTANRESGKDVTFDPSGSGGASGTPIPAQVMKQLPGPTSPQFDAEGLLGGDLPILLLGFPVAQGQPVPPTRGCDAGVNLFGGDLGGKHPAGNVSACAALCRETTGCAAYVFQECSTARTSSEPIETCYLKSGGWKVESGDQKRGCTLCSQIQGLKEDSSLEIFWEMSVVPVASGTGREQPVFIRFLQVNASAAAGDTSPGTMYFDSYSFNPSLDCKTDSLAGCGDPAGYFTAVLDNHFFWQQTWEKEGRMSLSLPARPQDTDGALLAMQASHALVLDMITRIDTVWPRYGTEPGYGEPGIGGDGFQEIFTSTMTAALEWGLYEYAHDVLDNWLSKFMGRSGFVMYRGLEMPQQARMLTVIAMYAQYTDDSSGLLIKHLDKIDGIGQFLNERYERAANAFPVGDSRRGMTIGNDEADLAYTSIGGGGDGTELPFISINAEMWRGLRDCGQALADLNSSLDDNSTIRREVAAVSQRMLSNVDAIRSALESSMTKDVIKGNGSSAPCHPYVAGVPECGMLPHPVSHRDSEAWRTYAEVMYSGALDNSTIREILLWHQTQQGHGVRGSRLKLGVLAGCGLDVSCGDQLETFTIHGWGWGLLQADLTEEYLLQFYALSAHAYTRGTWIASESSPIDRTKFATPFCTPAELTVPLLLKWALVWEHPQTQVLWFGRAIPRVWLSDGEHVRIINTTTGPFIFNARYGRVSMELSSNLDKNASIRASLTLPSTWVRPNRGRVPHGGIRLRLRCPGGQSLSQVTVGGRPWQNFDRIEEMIFVSAEELTTPGMAAALRDIIATYENQTAH